jgi:FolB domain-containing protein
MDKVFIKDLHIQAILGVRDWDRDIPQDILVNVTVMTNPPPVPKRDDIGDCVDYSEMAKEIRTLVETAQRFTVEALAEDIARLCLNKKGAYKVNVRVEKPGAVTGAASAGVEIERPSHLSNLER